MDYTSEKKINDVNNIVEYHRKVLQRKLEEAKENVLCDSINIKMYNSQN